MPLRGEGSCGGGGAPRDSAGSGRSAFGTTHVGCLEFPRETSLILRCAGKAGMDLLAVQGTLKSLLQHHSSKASIPRRSAFFTVQLSHPYMTTGKTIALTRRTFVAQRAEPLTHTHSCDRKESRGMMDGFPCLSPSIQRPPSVKW